MDGVDGVDNDCDYLIDEEDCSLENNGTVEIFTAALAQVVERPLC